MLSKCANPVCFTPFRYLRDGKLFEIDSNIGFENAVEAKKSARRVEFFWLCGECAAKMTVVRDPEKGVITVPIPQTVTAIVRRAAAS